MNPKEIEAMESNKTNPRLLEQTEAGMVLTLNDQVKLLRVWNKENINDNPEQVRKNTETILAIFANFALYQDHPASY